MILRSMKLENFRQYKGEETIEFAYENGNITIVLGENGKGKTGIYRGIRYALYGDTSIEQDDVDEQNRLVNMDVISESASKVGQAKVTVVIEYKKVVYQVSRVVKEMESGRKVNQKIYDPEIQILRDAHGNHSAEIIVDPVKTSQIINMIMPEGIKGFFIFDAERIDSLAKTDIKSRTQLKTGIFKAIQMENIIEAKSVIEETLKAERNSLKAQIASAELDKLEGQIKAIMNQIASKEGLLEEYEKNLVACKERETELSGQLEEDELIKGYRLKMDEKKNNLEKFEADIAEKKLDLLSKVMQTAPFLLAKDIMTDVTTYLDQVLEQSENIVPIEVLDLSLKNDNCLCCNNNLAVHEENRQYIQQLKDTYSRSDLVLLISSMKNTFANRMHADDEEITHLNTRMKNIAENREYAMSIRKDIAYLEDKIKQAAGGKLAIADIHKQYETVVAEMKRVEIQIGVLKDKIKALQKELKDTETKFNKLLSSQDNLAVERKVIDILSSLLDNVKEIELNFGNEMREKLQTKATEIFKEIIDPKDKELIKEVRINEKFEFILVGRDNIEMNSHISAGQRQMVALSIITALSNIASGSEGTHVRFPLFMDTPFGRISGINRDQLIQNIPMLTSQWILLLTDTEFSKTEQDVFLTTEQVGAWYRLEQVKPGQTNIQSIELDENLATRGV